jgi:ComF family protein
VNAALARGVVDPLLTLVFPSFCVVCRTLLAQPTSGPICPSCLHLLPRHAGPVCGCGVPLAAGVTPPCGRCRRGLSVFDAGASLGPYEGTLRTVLHALKYSRRRRLATRLADVLLADPCVHAILTPEALLAPVPLSGRREHERGFNQSELVARALGRRTGLTVVARALIRSRDTPPQAGLTAAQRRQNVAGAFTVRQRQAVAGRTVIIVDDVLTTGATARACAAALREAGASSVRVLTVARVL